MEAEISAPEELLVRQKSNGIIELAWFYNEQILEQLADVYHPLLRLSFEIRQQSEGVGGCLRIRKHICKCRTFSYDDEVTEQSCEIDGCSPGRTYIFSVRARAEFDGCADPVMSQYSTITLSNDSKGFYSDDWDSVCEDQSHFPEMSCITSNGNELHSSVLFDDTHRYTRSVAAYREPVLAMILEDDELLATELEEQEELMADEGHMKLTETSFSCAMDPHTEAESGMQTDTERQESECVLRCLENGLAQNGIEKDVWKYPIAGGDSENVTILCSELGCVEKNIEEEATHTSVELKSCMEKENCGKVEFSCTKIESTQDWADEGVHKNNKEELQSCYKQPATPKKLPDARARAQKDQQKLFDGVQCQEEKTRKRTDDDVIQRRNKDLRRAQVQDDARKRADEMERERLFKESQRLEARALRLEEMQRQLDQEKALWLGSVKQNVGDNGTLEEGLQQQGATDCLKLALEKNHTMTQLEMQLDIAGEVKRYVGDVVEEVKDKINQQGNDDSRGFRFLELSAMASSKTSESHGGGRGVTQPKMMGPSYGCPSLQSQSPPTVHTSKSCSSLHARSRMVEPPVPPRRQTIQSPHGTRSPQRNMPIPSGARSPMQPPSCAQKYVQAPGRSQPIFRSPPPPRVIRSPRSVLSAVQIEDKNVIQQQVLDKRMQPGELGPNPSFTGHNVSFLPLSCDTQPRSRCQSPQTREEKGSNAHTIMTCIPASESICTMSPPAVGDQQATSALIQKLAVSLPQWMRSDKGFQLPGHAVQPNARVESKTNRSSEVSPRLMVQARHGSTSPQPLPTLHLPIGVKPVHPKELHFDASQQLPGSFALQSFSNTHNGWASANDVKPNNDFMKKFWVKQTSCEPPSQRVPSPHSMKIPSVSKNSRDWQSPKVPLEKCENVGLNALLHVPSPTRRRNAFIKPQFVSISAAGLSACK